MALSSRLHSSKSSLFAIKSLYGTGFLSIPDGRYKYEFGEEEGCDVSCCVTAFILLVFTILTGLLVQGGRELLLIKFVVGIGGFANIVVVGTAVVVGSSVVVVVGIVVAVVGVVLLVKFVWFGESCCVIMVEGVDVGFNDASSLTVILTLTSLFRPETEAGMGPVTLTVLGGGAGLLTVGTGTVIFTQEDGLGGEGAMLA